MRDILNDLDAGRLSDPDPARRAQKQMLKPLPKRFYTEAGVAAEGEGFAVTLDGRLVRTPGRHGMILPTEAAARLVADEYGAQGETINPMTMPVTRLANTAIDGVAADMQAVAEDIQRFSSSDLLCYRAGEPEGLAERQRAQWDPVVAWAGETLEVTVTPTYSGCPATSIINLDILAALRERGLEKIELKRRLSPAWTTAWISQKGREKLRAFGIAPPVEGTAACGIGALETPEVACPHCGSKATRRVSQFGSTPCKANWVCNDCGEPFDYFKCI